MNVTSSSSAQSGNPIVSHKAIPAESTEAHYKAESALPHPHQALTHPATASRLAAMPVFVNPADRSKKDEATRKLALVQTIAARKLLYYPGKAVCEEIKKAAMKFQAIMNLMTPVEMNLFMSMNFRTNELLPEKSSKALHEILARLIDVESATATDRAAFISIMGYVGKKYMGTLKKQLKGSAVPEKSRQFLNMFSEKLKRLGLPALSDDVVERIRVIGDSTSLAPRKRHEQPEAVNQKNMDAPPSRAGVHDLGDEADAVIGIDQDKRLPRVRWPVAKIDDRRVSNTLEPFVDHMSGRPAKALMIWDLLCGERQEDLYIGLLESQMHAAAEGQTRAMPMESLGASQQQAKLARSAATNAVLVGVGYHSALELIEGALIYSGQNLRSELDPSADAGHLLGQGAATDLMIELFEQQTRKDGAVAQASGRGEF